MGVRRAGRGCANLSASIVIVVVHDDMPHPVFPHQIWRTLFEFEFEFEF